MKRSPRSSLLFVVKGPLISLWAASLVVLACSSEVFAATPVDIYQSMESGNAGDLLTSTIMNASSHGGGSTWSLYSGSAMWVSNNFAMNLPGPVSVAGTVYPGTGSTRTWVYNDNNANDYVMCTLAGSYNNITVAMYYTPGVTIEFANQFDTINMSGLSGWAVMQTRNDDGNGPYLCAHSSTAGWVTTFSYPAYPLSSIKIVPGKNVLDQPAFRRSRGEHLCGGV